MRRFNSNRKISHKLTPSWCADQAGRESHIGSAINVLPRIENSCTFYEVVLVLIYQSYLYKSRSYFFNIAVLRTRCLNIGAFEYFAFAPKESVETIQN